MSRPFQVEISESIEELEKALKHAITASSKERLQMLYWLKSGQLSSRQALAERLGRDQATITRWLRKYKDGGRSSLLEVKHALLASAYRQRGSLRTSETAVAVT
jgi:DNA-binding transcriptional ArsR family regulator